jgi:hypothetical protein
MSLITIFKSMLKIVNLPSAALLHVLLTFHFYSFSQEKIFDITASKPIKESVLKNSNFQISGSELIFIKEKNARFRNQQFEAEFHTINLANLTSYKTKLISKDNIFGIIKVPKQHISHSSRYLFIVANEYKNFDDTCYFNSLYIFKRIGPHTFINIDVIKNYQAYEGQIIELNEERILIYKNYDFHPQDDTVPSRISVYDLYNKTFIHDHIFRFDGLYLTNLVGNFITKLGQYIFMAIPTKNIIVKYDFDLHIIDTLFVPINGNYQVGYNIIDSLKSNIPHKKQFITEAKKVDKFIERLESLFTFDSSNIGITVKPYGIGDFSNRILYTYNILTNKITNHGVLDYSNYNIGQQASEPNLTYNDPGIKYVNTINRIMTIEDNLFLLNNKLTGDDRLHIKLFSFRPNQQNILNNSKGDFINSVSDDSYFLHDLSFNKYALEEFLKPNTAILVINNRNCEPCINDAFKLLKNQYRGFSKVAIVQSRSDNLWASKYSAYLKKNAKLESVLFTNSYFYNGHDLMSIPSPYLLVVYKSGEYRIIPFTIK